MKHLFLLLACLLAFQVQAQDDDYQMYQAIVIKPLPGHQQQLHAALKAHNEAYHQEGKERVNVWSFMNGERAGSLLWVKGPLTWSDMDNPITDEGHMDDWWNNVSKHATLERMEFWHHWDGLHYMPDGFQPRVLVLRYFDVKPQKWNNVKHVWDSVFGVYEKENWDTGLRVYWNEANAGDDRDMMGVWYHENFSSFDVDRNFFDKYEEEYDIDRREYFENWNDLVDFKGMDIVQLVDDLSVSGSDE